MKGVYSLVLKVKRDLNIRAGSLESHTFPRGCYVYNGSALGAGGLESRIGRHRHIDKYGPSHFHLFWHIDYILAHENVTLTAIVAAQTTSNLECEINRYMKEKGGADILVPGFGASDCQKRCKSHLLFFSDRTKGVVRRIEEAYTHFKLSATVWHLPQP